MTTTKAHALAALGQSIWYDNIRRTLLESGGLQKLVEAGVLGVTSNPTIFERAIAGSTDYDTALQGLVQAGRSVEEIYEALAVEDIRAAADILQPIYEQTNGVDGYISLEVSPKLAHDTERTIAEGRRLFAEVGRPNVMIKVPATPEGIPAVQALISEGININVTLIFALDAYQAVMEAYLRGLEQLAERGGDLVRVASVASFFVSRVDSLVDGELAKLGNTDLQGKIAIANAKLAYEAFRQVFSGERWARLLALGARVQRPLWASTSTKNPNYPDTIYVDNLIGADTVNTVPPATLDALQDHATVALTIEQGLDEAKAHLAQLAALGIDMQVVTEQLLREGVSSFAKSFESLMDSIELKRERLISESQRRYANLGEAWLSIRARLEQMDAHDIIQRIYVKDHTVWKPEPTEISNRLGWLNIATRLNEPEVLERLYALTDEVWADGIKQVVLLGMGGSSLAPELFAKVYGSSVGNLDVHVLDSTDPDHVRAFADRFAPRQTLYIVSTKSGGTVETVSFFKTFYNRVLEAYDGDAHKAGQHFIAITDPGSAIEQLAKDYHFRTAFLNDPEIGGRYSALSYFGLVPAALDGIYLPRLLESAEQMQLLCSPAHDAVYNPAAWLGAILGEMALRGRDKVTFITSNAIASFGDWVEQLIAESTGKEGKGILPVVGESVGAPESYGADRLFVYLQLEGETQHEAAFAALEKAGHPTVRFVLRDKYDLGGQFFLWELATAVAGYILGINPFDQPNVESAKVAARQVVAAYREQGALPAQTPALTDGALTLYGEGLQGGSAAAAFKAFASAVAEGGYIGLHAYLPPTPSTDSALALLRLRLRELTGRAVTVGYGPRFLHSTGQLHKGDAGLGAFIQFTNTPEHDLPIPDAAGKPDSAMSFGVLKLAQALGDAQALREGGRRVLRIDLGADVIGGLRALLEGLAAL
ncbi:MAG: bifunctional transaldolase/phosoglucose isomerase [Chloroflexi bacterium CFX4]|nr:bifunctional transaldolase/phosoglucose isomerase [Chloroflexi bacterium CFX4]MDL1923401.1 bifunctional transaldolase/phosoglucose isomerase [Chloroflexi bacterium CFX3]